MGDGSGEEDKSKVNDMHEWKVLIKLNILYANWKNITHRENDRFSHLWLLFPISYWLFIPRVYVLKEDGM